MAEDRDHKKLGKELELFYIDETIGKGLPVWLPKGAAIRREIERFIVDEEIKRGYQHVYTPDIARLALYEKSGHYPYYKDSMYAPIKVEDEEFMLRPMTCPHHFQLYLSRPRSYRDLPMRIAELAKLYRFEQSGELMGLQRVRSFCLSDAHIICKSEGEAVQEMGQALDLIEFANGVLGLEFGKDYWYRLSLGDRADTKKYYKDDAGWDMAEKLLRGLMKKRGVKFEEMKGDAAFYGPKIDVQMKNANGKEDTAFTVQYDLSSPVRFNLTFVGEDGKEHRPFVVHRSSIGSIERTIAFLIEKYAGAFPLWLSPVQVKVLPISSEKHLECAQDVYKSLMDAGIRAELDESNETLGKKVRQAKVEKVPYLVVIGDKEKETRKFTIEGRNDEKIEGILIEDFIARLKEEIKNKS
ncbi:MAG: threonine--tRNA ligase [Patescibacteria group bacterium]